MNIKDEFTSAPKAKHLTANRQFQGIPGIESTPGGRLWATWYAGGVNEGPDNFVVLVTSSDRGETWSEPVAVVDPPGDIRAYDPTLWIDPLGRMWFFWARCRSRHDGNIFDGTAGVWAVHCPDPESERPTWSEPIRLANGVMMNKPIVLSNGDWAFPTAVWADHGGGVVPEQLKNERFSNLTISQDQGKTFFRRGGADVPNRGFDEHMVVELKDGRLWMLVRQQLGVGQSFSSDLGATWTPGEDSPVPGPGSRFFIRHLASGRLLLVNHQVDHAEPYKRQMLTAWLSEDDGQSWKGGLVLDAREGISYPDGKQDANGDIWIIYDYQRYKEGDILFARFREEDVLGGKPGAKLRGVVNHSGGLR